MSTARFPRITVSADLDTRLVLDERGLDRSEICGVRREARAVGEHAMQALDARLRAL